MGAEGRWRPSPLEPELLISLGAYVDAIMAGADEADADNIARAIEAQKRSQTANELRLERRHSSHRLPCYLSA